MIHIELPSASRILSEADQLITGDRAEQYGHPRINFNNISVLWSIQLKMEISPRQVALMLAGLKLIREINSPKRDSLVDLAAYAALAEEVS